MLNMPRDYSDKLRLVDYVDPNTGKGLRFLSNNYAVPALTIAHLYRCSWQVELFFLWIKQHLRIKSFFGTSENALRAQTVIVVSVFVLGALHKKSLHLENAPLYTILQILSVSLFKKRPNLQDLSHSPCTIPKGMCDNRLESFTHQFDMYRVPYIVDAATIVHNLRGL
jgi:hypothetical protein